MTPAPLPRPADLRRDYRLAGLSEADLAATWHEQFGRWFADAAALLEPNAVVLATASADGRPSARTVLLKAYDARGLVVFTNLTSRKGREALANPVATLLFPWVELERQVVVTGAGEQVTPEETADYFRSRPRSSQIGAWVSRQSSVVPDREALERRRAEHAEAPRVGEVVVGRPAREVEERVERLPIDGTAVVGLVRPPRADEVFEFHGRGG